MSKAMINVEFRIDFFLRTLLTVRRRERGEMSFPTISVEAIEVALRLLVFGSIDFSLKFLSVEMQATTFNKHQLTWRHYFVCISSEYRIRRRVSASSFPLCPRPPLSGVIIIASRAADCSGVGSRRGEGYCLFACGVRLELRRLGKSNN